MVIDIVTRAMWTATQMAAPILAVTIAVGVLMGLLQSVTQIRVIESVRLVEELICMLLTREKPGILGIERISQPCSLVFSLPSPISSSRYSSPTFGC